MTSIWHIQEISGDAGVAGVVLECSQRGKGFPKGSDSQQKDGFSFFEVRKQGDSFVGEYITSRISADPILIAVTQSQYDNWKKQGIVIIARPCVFVWGPERFV